ncbi:elongation factor G [Paracraurococcus ruber]|uniref:Elongation factor G n=2 Tax=Paracraurococcus ruber TaxID=77675 RepID=A0ABS1CWD9_9PROT|nr:elongation factor G [Paracraurococcus ruber]MBK1658621.1 elongation factor G [Paracraurococcus ruber]TDG30807.1 elongation factor G [Paracraurococcus ruber]
MPDASGRQPGGARPRSVAFIGPQGAGKSTLMDALLAAAGAPPRRGGPRGMGTELRLAHASHMGDSWSLLDCPGSVEFAHDAACAAAVCDLAVVVAEAAPGRAAALGPVFRMLDARGTPAIVFVNKIDQLDGRVRDTLAAMQAQTQRKVVLRQVPIREGDHVTGYVDVVSERAYRYRRGAPSERIALPESIRAREAEARAELLEALADHDDALLEKVLEDLAPEPAEIYRPLHTGELSGAVVSVLLGAAEHNNGIHRLWKALRHDVPAPEETAARLGIAEEGPPLAQVFRTVHAGHAGRLSWARLWRGPVKDGTALDGHRIGGIHRFPNGEAQKAPEAQAGEIVALGRMEGVATGTTLGATPAGESLGFPAPTPPVHAVAVVLEDRKDEVRLSAALQRLAEEDPALQVVLDPESGQTVLHGQGELHLRAALDRLSAGAGMKLRTVRPQVPYRETIRHAVTQHARLKRQTGGHGQFADVKIRIEPRPRGDGFAFAEEVVGGAVPRRFIPAVGEAAEEATAKGPLGHRVVDVAVTLLDGGFHSVDSSDMAFATATRMAMQEGLAKADPVLLEPVHAVTVSVPAEYTPNAQRLLTGRRGQILGYAAKEGWEGWDCVEALVPAAELQEFIIELRSQTQGLGSYTHRFDHLAEARHR